MTKQEADRVVDEVLTAEKQGREDQQLFERAVDTMRQAGIHTKKAMAKRLGWAEREFQRVCAGDRKISPRKRGDLQRLLLEGKKAPKSSVRTTRPRTPEKLALGNLIRHARVAAKMSVDEAARKVGFTRSGYSNIERGDTGASKVKLLAIGELFPAVKATDQFRVVLARAKIGSRPYGHRAKKTAVDMQPHLNGVAHSAKHSAPPPRGPEGMAAFYIKFSRFADAGKGQIFDAPRWLGKLLTLCREAGIPDSDTVTLLTEVADLGE
jgi:DNA-binding XRE family transcriptional regulator